MSTLIEHLDWYIGKLFNYFHTYFTNSLDWIVISVAIPTTLIIIEVMAKGWQKSSLKRLLNPSGSALNDWVSFLFVYTKIHDLLGYALLLGIAWFIPKEIKSVFGYDIIRMIPSPILQLIIAFIVIDFLDYWAHRIEHRSKSLWELHKYHHAATEFNIISGKRVHPIADVSFKRLLYALPFAIMGSPVSVFVGFVYLRSIMSCIQHSELNWRLGWIGKYLLISPLAHRIHHSTNEAHFNKNLGTVLVWWDKLFGTWYEPEADEYPEIGVEDTDLNHPNYFVNIFRSTRAAFQKLLT